MLGEGCEKCDEGGVEPVKAGGQIRVLGACE